jgi:hypothetical protein
VDADELWRILDVSFGLGELLNERVGQGEVRFVLKTEGVEEYHLVSCLFKDKRHWVLLVKNTEVDGPNRLVFMGIPSEVVCLSGKTASKNSHDGDAVQPPFETRNPWAQVWDDLLLFSHHFFEKSFVLWIAQFLELLDQNNVIFVGG